MKHRLYVDEVGNPDLGSSDRDDHRFLCLAGVIFNLKYVNDVLNPQIEKQFNKELLSKLDEWAFTVISVTIDKKEHVERYSTWRYDPYHYCLEVLLERYIFFLDSVNCPEDVMAESRGGKEDRRLKDAYNRLYKNGTDIRQVLIEDSSRHELQIGIVQKQVKIKWKARRTMSSENRTCQNCNFFQELQEPQNGIC